MNVIDLDSIPSLTISVKNGFDFSNSKQLVDMLNGKSNISLTITAADLFKLDNNGELAVPTKTVIRNASELSREDLTKHKCISTVQISDKDNTGTQQEEPYTKEEYESVRSEIDKILSQVEYPPENDPNREKKIFAQIYRILGEKISYDYNAISKAEKDNKRLQTTCRNLIGGLLENKCVCAGYADILRNTLACAGIYSEYIAASPDIESGVKFFLDDPQGHAWNLVMLDGQRYWTDLTWDASQIKAGRYPLDYCLKSTKDFKHDRYEKRLQDRLDDPCPESLTDEEQVMLFTEKELTKKTPEKKQEDRNIGYLSSFVMSVADTGLTSTNVRKIANEIGLRPVAYALKESNKEVSDERS